MIHGYIITHFIRGPSEFDFVYIVNIVELATVIKKHYDLFQRYVGFDFNPLEVVFDIQNEYSPFWNKIFNDDPITPEGVCLMGILFGYGFENSYYFSLTFEKERTGVSKEFSSYLFKQLSKSMEPTGVKQFSSRDFSIPGFRTFSKHNPTKSRYEMEKIEIMELYKGKGLGKTTLKLLYQN